MGYQYSSLNHVHSYNGDPLIGTTTSLKVISKPLTWWASGMAAGKMGWIHKQDKRDERFKDNTPERCLEVASAKLEEIKKMDGKQYLKLVSEAYRAHSERLAETAEAGIDMHALVEQYIKTVINGESPAVPKELETFDEWVKKNVAEFLFSEAHCYSEKLWLGGISDFAYLNRDGLRVLSDVKNRDKAYFTDFVQCGLYDIQICENGILTAEGVTISSSSSFVDGFSAYAVFPMMGFYEPAVCVHTEKMKEAGKAALALYKIKSAFEGSKK